MRALVIGSSGKTGMALVSRLIGDREVRSVHTFSRKAISMDDKKLTQHIIDFDKIENWASEMRGDVAFSCLGTTLKIAGSQAAQKKVDVDYQYNFAKIVFLNGVKKFVLVSSLGASPGSFIFYSKIKGQLEEKVKDLGFKELVILRPGMLDRGDSDRAMEEIGLKALTMLNNIGLFSKQKPLPVSKLAKAMIYMAKGGSKKGISILTGHEIFQVIESKG